MGLRPTPKYPAAHENNSSDTPGSCAFVLASCVNVLCSSRNLYVVKDCVTTLKGHVQSDASTSNLLLGQQCWELLAHKFDRFQILRNNFPTTRNNMQQGVQTDATCNTQQCCVPLHGTLETIRTQLSSPLLELFRDNETKQFK